MMTVLKPIAFDVVVCMSQLFDYYLYSVSVFLGIVTVIVLLALDESTTETYELMAYIIIAGIKND